MRFTLGMPTLFILLHVTFIINETFLSNCQNVSAKVLFRLVEEKKQKADNNVTVFQELLKQIGSTKPPPTEAQKNQAFKILGKRYNPDYQSVKKPPDFKDSKQITEEDLEKNMDKSLKTQQFKIPGLSTRKLHKRAKKHFRLYLQQLSHCQLSYKWQDLGSLVWPRYIKETYCVSKGCSYPRGMTCQRSEKDMINVTLLYWTCHRRVRKSEVRRCGWSMVHINAVTQCICTCGDST